MINPTRAIKKWFISTVSTATSLLVGDGIVPEGSGNEYIVLTSRFGNQIEGKTGFNSNVIITLDIVTRGSFTGYKRSEDIAQLILTAIDSDTAITLSTGQATSLYLATITNLDGLNPLDNVFRTIITYNVIISG